MDYDTFARLNGTQKWLAWEALAEERGHYRNAATFFACVCMVLSCALAATVVVYV